MAKELQEGICKKLHTQSAENMTEQSLKTSISKYVPTSQGQEKKSMAAISPTQMLKTTVPGMR